MSKYILLGFPKCGQHSIIKLFERRGDEIKSREICWQRDALQIYEKQYLDYTPVFVRRNIDDFLKSGYNNWGYAAKGILWKDYLMIQGYDESKFGEQNPIARAQFGNWIWPFMKYNPLIFQIEDIREHENRTENCLV